MPDIKKEPRSSMGLAYLARNKLSANMLDSMNKKQHVDLQTQLDLADTLAEYDQNIAQPEIETYDDEVENKQPFTVLPPPGAAQEYAHPSSSLSSTSSSSSSSSTVQPLTVSVTMPPKKS